MNRTYIVYRIGLFKIGYIKVLYENYAYSHVYCRAVPIWPALASPANSDLASHFWVVRRGKVSRAGLPICHLYAAAKQGRGKLGPIPVPIAQTNLFFLLSPFATKQIEGPLLLFPPIPLPPQRPFMEQVLSISLSSLATGFFPVLELDVRIAQQHRSYMLLLPFYKFTWSLYLMLYLFFYGLLEYAICSWCKFILRSFFSLLLLLINIITNLLFDCGCGYWPGFVFTL